MYLSLHIQERTIQYKVNELFLHHHVNIIKYWLVRALRKSAMLKIVFNNIGTRKIDVFVFLKKLTKTSLQPLKL